MKLRALPPMAAVDVLAIVLLTVISMAGLSQSLDGERWIVVAGAGLGIGVLWTLLILTLGAGMDIAIETLPLPYFATAGAIALGSDGLFFGIPDTRTLGDVLTGTVTGWRRLVDTAPPVDSVGVVLLIPFVLTLALSGVATAMALRSRRAVLPLLPLLVMLRPPAPQRQRPRQEHRGVGRGTHRQRVVACGAHPALHEPPAPSAGGGGPASGEAAPDGSLSSRQ